jgi:hypothetical protein
MTAGRHDLNVHQGDNFQFTATFRDPLGQPLDLTGWTFRAQIRADVADRGDIVDEFTIGMAAGQVVLALDPEQTLLLPGGRLLYELEGTRPDGVVSTWLAGRVLTRLEVTR